MTKTYTLSLKGQVQCGGAGVREVGGEWEDEYNLGTSPGLSLQFSFQLLDRCLAHSRCSIKYLLNECLYIVRIKILTHKKCFELQNPM